MLQSFYNGLASMTNFSRGLDNVSNNISNMNTPGYRGRDVFFRSVNGSADSDYGVKVEGEAVRLKPGDIRQTGNRTDLAINGRGYFVLSDETGSHYYTRAGQFRFNKENTLVDAATDYRVMGLSNTGMLVDFNIDKLISLAPVATSSVKFSGNLSRTSESHQIDSLAIYDESGSQHNVRVVFENNQDNTWTVKIADENQAPLSEFVIAFAANGSPAEGGSSSIQDIAIGGSTVEIEFDFGTPGSFNSTTQFSEDSTLSGLAEDGRGAVGLGSFEFNEKGEISLQYINGETRTGQTLALANVEDEAKLRVITGGIYSQSDGAAVTYGKPSTEQFGLIEGGSIELSNVELTQEFADMLIIQRGYQASARVMSVANEMIEQLYSNNR